MMITFDVHELAALDPEAGCVRAPTATVAEDQIQVTLAAMPHEGEGDGSSELMRVARRAVSLGVERESFVAAVSAWNAKRLDPWDEDGLLKRYDDVRARWDEEGLAKVPMGQYARAALDQIVREDRRYAGRLTWDELEQRVCLDGEPLGERGIARIEVEICQRYAWRSLPTIALEASVVMAAHERPVNRVTEYLAGLTWDGRSRDAELVEALGVVEEHRELAAVYLRKMRIAAVARALEPGVKVDNMVVLVGPEGAGKSTAFRILAGSENFRDTKIELEDKDSYMQIHRAWIYEWGELESITSRADVARVKNFLSSSTDSYRAPYARTVADHPRRGIIVGTSNSHDLIQDLDSDRRYWIVEVEDGATIDLEWLRQHRDQLWAEAVAAAAEGEPLFLTTEQERQRAEVNDDFRPENPLQERLSVIVAELAAKPENKAGIPSKTLTERLGLDSSTNPRVFAAVNSIMRKLGFRRQRWRENGRFVRGYKSRRNGLILVSIPVENEGVPGVPGSSIESLGGSSSQIIDEKKG